MGVPEQNKQAKVGLGALLKVLHFFTQERMANFKITSRTLNWRITLFSHPWLFQRWRIPPPQGFLIEVEAIFRPGVQLLEAQGPDHVASFRCQCKGKIGAPNPLVAD